MEPPAVAEPGCSSASPSLKVRRGDVFFFFFFFLLVQVGLLPGSCTSRTSGVGFPDWRSCPRRAVPSYPASPRPRARPALAGAVVAEALLTVFDGPVVICPCVHHPRTVAVAVAGTRRAAGAVRSTGHGRLTQADPGNESAMMSSHDDHISRGPALRTRTTGSSGRIGASRGTSRTRSATEPVVPGPPTGTDTSRRRRRPRSTRSSRRDGRSPGALRTSVGAGEPEEPGTREATETPPKRQGAVSALRYARCTAEAIGAAARTPPRRVR